MRTPNSLESLGSLVSEKRGKVGVRATAAAIGISPAHAVPGRKTDTFRTLPISRRSASGCRLILRPS